MHAGRRFRLGLLALIAGGSFLGLIGFVLQGVLRNDRVSYFILFEENVKGMVIGSKCNFQGVPFGMVKDIRFQKGKTLVELSVDPTRGEIQDITRARLDRLLVTGQVTVELEGYGPDGVALQPGQFVEPKRDPINQLTQTLPELVPQLTEIMSRLEVVLDRGGALLDDQNRVHVSKILENADATLAALPAAIEQGQALMQRVDAAMHTLERAAVAFSDELLPKSMETLADTRGVAAEVRQLAAAGQTLLAGLRSPMQSGLASLRGSLDELRGLLRQLRLAPDSLLFGVARPAAPAGGGR
jgi:ABC-type transporter Mla subunit MlaD